MASRGWKYKTYHRNSVTEFTFLTTKRKGENNKQIPDVPKNTNFDPENNVLPINDLPF
jgi:single-strand DNA-binding protein